MGNISSSQDDEHAPPSADLLATHVEDLIDTWGEAKWAPAESYPQVTPYDVNTNQSTPSTNADSPKRHTIIFPAQWKEYLEAKALEEPRPRPRLPDVLFTEPYFIIRNSPKGYGAFASQDIAKGTIVHVELPLMSTVAHNQTLIDAFQGLSDEEKNDVVSLTSWDRAKGNNQLTKIFTINAFITGHTRAVFRISCRFNHACIPRNNIDWRWDDEAGRICFRAQKDIRGGDELNISYGYPPQALLDQYGFRCDCGCDLVPPALGVAHVQSIGEGETGKDREWIAGCYRQLDHW